MGLFSFDKRIKISNIGLRYVGFLFDFNFFECYNIVIYNVIVKLVNELNKRVDSNFDITVKENSNLMFSNDKIDLRESNSYIITIPTLVDDKNILDLSLLFIG